MNKICLTCILLSLSLMLSAQGVSSYHVYIVKGEVYKTMRKGKQTVRNVVHAKDILKGSDVIAMAQDSELKLVNVSDSTMAVLRNQCSGSIMSLISSQSGARQSMTGKYFAFVMKSLIGNGFDEGFSSGRTTTTYRDDTDSLFTSGEDTLFYDEDYIRDASNYFPVLNMSCLPYLVRILPRIERISTPHTDVISLKRRWSIFIDRYLLT